MLSEKDLNLIKELAQNMSIDDINEVTGMLNSQRRTYFGEISERLEALNAEKKKIQEDILSIRREVIAEANRLKKEGDIKSSRELFMLAESAAPETLELQSEELVHESPFFKDLQVNDSVSFGRYPQGGDDTISSPLLWKVLDIRGNKALLLTKYAVACHEYNDAAVKITWNETSLNKWLNSDFIRESFTGDEQSVLISDRAEPCIGKKQFRPDRVFILGMDDIESYMADERLRTCYGTIHTLKQGAGHFIDSTNVSWWIKTDIHEPNHASVITPVGSVCRNKNVSDRFICVRPAVWVRYR